MNWIAGIVELTSKVRYGLTSRGVPIFRFVPYDKRIPPFAVGCSERNLFHTIHAIVEPVSKGEPSAGTYTKTLPKANIVQILGIPNEQTELKVLLATYAYDNQKELRFPLLPTPLPQGSNETRKVVEGFTFHIDPPGCRDVDDTFTMRYDQEKRRWNISINIADVSAWVEEGSAVDMHARKKATSFYSPTGEALAPMLPPHVEEAATLLPGVPKPTFSLEFIWDGKVAEFQWAITTTQTNTSYTYDEADADLPNSPYLQVLKGISDSLVPLEEETQSNSHIWVQSMMILYNKHAGETLKKSGKGILRTHSEAKAKLYSILGPEFAFLDYEAATYAAAAGAGSASAEAGHYGLGLASYAYASSPIRRYCDLVNQRILKGLPSPIEQDLIPHLNRRQKQAKAFSRDLFFMSCLSSSKETKHGVVVSSKPGSMRIFVPVWKRCITSKAITDADLSPGTKVTIAWFEDIGKPNWKEKIIFRILE